MGTPVSLILVIGVRASHPSHPAFHRATPAHLVRRGRRDPKANKGLRGRRDLPARRGPRASKGLRDRRDFLALRVLRASKGPRDRRDTPVLRVPKASKDLRARMGQQGVDYSLTQRPQENQRKKPVSSM